MLAQHQQNLGIEDCGNSKNFYGIITSGSEKIGCNASFDVMTADYKEVYVEIRSMFPVVDPDEEDQEHDHAE